jgi:hypothetical protein
VNNVRNKSREIAYNGCIAKVLHNTNQDADSITMKLVVSLLLVLLTACAYHSVGAQVYRMDGTVVNPIRHEDQQRIARIQAIWTSDPDKYDSSKILPNPFCPPTGPNFLLSKTGEVLVEIRDNNDLLIDEVFRGTLKEGYYVVVFRKNNTNPGKYTLRIHYQGREDEKEIVLY